MTSVAACRPSAGMVTLPNTVVRGRVNLDPTPVQHAPNPTATAAVVVCGCGRGLKRLPSDFTDGDSSGDDDSAFSGEGVGVTSFSCMAVDV